MAPTASGSSLIARVGESIIIAPFFVLGGALPGVALIALNRRIARWAFPDSDPPDFKRRDVLIGEAGEARAQLQDVPLVSLDRLVVNLT